MCPAVTRYASRCLPKKPSAVPVAEPPSRYDPHRHHRRSIRLPHHDYAGGVYFVTICTHGHLHLFGDVTDGEMVPNDAGRIVHGCWNAIPHHFPLAVVDAFVVMPNHVHGIVGIMDDGPAANDGVGAQHAAPLRSVDRNGRCNITAGTLPAIVRSFKSAVTKRTNAMRRTPGGAVWQRNYYERVIRDDRALHIARRYIADNPLRWRHDRCHPEHR